MGTRTGGQRHLDLRGWTVATPGDGTGLFADLVNQARADGIVWATAAGNEHLEHWGGQFSDPDGNDAHNFTSARMNLLGLGVSHRHRAKPMPVERGPARRLVNFHADSTCIS